MKLLERAVDAIMAYWPQVKPSTSAIKQCKLIAHRGAHDHSLVENTLPAFRRAKELGVWGIELDIHYTLDGQVVVHHDPDLTRLWSQPNKIAATSFEELRSICPQIPTLREVVQQCAADLHLFIELKTPVINEAALLNSLEGLVVGQDYHLISLDVKNFAGLSGFKKDHQLLVAEEQNTGQLVNRVLEDNFGGVLGHYLLLHNGRLRRLRQHNKRIGVGFIASKNSLTRELNRGLSWLFTDKAEQCVADLAALRGK
jgi:glycerophosphoryl diester phosphodiesterase